MKKKPQEKKLYVNLGCGAHIVQSKDKSIKWLNIDNFYTPEGAPDFLKGDIRAIPLESGTVDYIICDNVLEHLQMSDIPIALYEIRRILKVGGRAVIIVPEFNDVIKQWQAVDHNVSFNPYLYKYVSEEIFGSQLHPGEFHSTPFCVGFLNYSLQMCGLRKYRLVLHPAFGDVPNYPGVGSRPGSMCRFAVLVADITKES